MSRILSYVNALRIRRQILRIFQALIEGTLDDYDKKNKKRTKGVEKKLRGIDFVGEGAEVIIEGNDRKKKKKETPWERDLRQGRYGKALDSAFERKLDSVTVSTTLLFHDYETIPCPSLPFSLGHPDHKWLRSQYMSWFP
jgi:hypothetical protein